MQFPAEHSNHFAETLNQKRLNYILKMAVSHADFKQTKNVLDVGCGTGALSLALAQAYYSVGFDVAKSCVRVQGKLDTDFVYADAYNLPFRPKSFDFIVCASVLEHVLKIDDILMKLKKLLKEDGILFAGYPIETRLFKTIWRVVSPAEFKYIDQTQKFFYNSTTHEHEDYWTKPDTHKQTYVSIRKALNRQFKLIKKVKLPFNSLPDFANYYECLKATNGSASVFSS